MSAFLPLAFALPIVVIDLTILVAGVAIVTGAIFLIQMRKRLVRRKARSGVT